MKIIIDGTPVCQIRMKFSGRNGIGRVYDPRAKEKKRIKELLAQSGNPITFMYPRVSFVFHMPIPCSIPKRMLPLYRSGLLKHTKKPDTDNFIKLYLDCLDEIYFQGDQKVSLGNCVKLYHPHPKTLIIINEMQEIITDSELDLEVWNLLFEQEGDESKSSEIPSLPDCDDLLL